MSSQVHRQSAKRRVWTFIDYFVPQEALHHQMPAFILNKMQPFRSEGLIEEVKRLLVQCEPQTVVRSLQIVDFFLLNCQIELSVCNL